MKYNFDEVIDRTGTNSYKWDIAEGELPMWLDCTSLGITSRELAKHIRKSTGLYLSSGDIYGSRECFLRMNIACPRAMVQNGLERLLKAVRTLSL